MTPETIFKTMQDLIAEQFAIDADEVTMDSSFVDDLGADSLGIVDLVMALEDEFDIEIGEDQYENFKTVGDIVKYIEETIPAMDFIKRLIRHMPEKHFKMIRYGGL